MRLSALFLVLSPALLFAGEWTVPFEVHRGQKVLIVAGKANGEEIRMVLDTGSSATILSREFGGLALKERSTFKDGAGLDARGQWSEVTLRIGSLQLARRPVVFIDFTEVRKTYGDVDGILGNDVLSEFDSFRIDYRSRTMTLSR